MKYKIGDKTLLGEISVVDAGDADFPYRVRRDWRGGVWLRESEVDKIIIKPKRNIDHIIELWESGKRHDAEDLYANLVDKSDSMAGDVLVLLDSYIEPSKYPKLTPEELRAVKWLSDGGYTGISIERTNIILHIENDQFMPQARYFPIIEHLIEAKWLTCKPLNLKNLLDAQGVGK